MTVGALFIAMQAHVAVPAKADEPARLVSNQIQTKSNNERSASQQPAQLNAGCRSSISSNDSCREVPEGRENSVRITSFPSVTIANKPKTLLDHVFDWGPWLFNLGLLLVGAFQIFLLYVTWTRIRKQAELMGGQLAEMKSGSQIADKSAAAAKLAARAQMLAAKASLLTVEMIKSKERARLVLHVPHSAPSPAMIIEDLDQGTLQPLEIKIAVTNEGNSGAFRVRAYGGVAATPIKDACDTSAKFRLDILPIIRVATSENPVLLSIQSRKGDISSIPAEDWAAVRFGEKALHVFGAVAYDNVYEGRWYTPFHFVWQVNRLGEDASDVEEEWRDISTAGRRIKKKKKDQKLN